MPHSSDALQQQIRGERPNGTVTLRSFDQGIVEALGAQVNGDRYYVNIEGVNPPDGDPGIPVHFFFPEDLYANFRYPAFVVSRDDMSISFNRIHPFQAQYRAPAKTALETVAAGPGGTQVVGFDAMSSRLDAAPYDITYTINIYNNLRGGFGGRAAGNKMLDHVLRRFPPYGAIFVKDSLGVVRSYEAFNEGIANLDDIAGISERTILFAVTVRVEAEYDLADETTSRTVTRQPTVNVSGR